MDILLNVRTGFQITICSVSFGIHGIRNEWYQLQNYKAICCKSYQNIPQHLKFDLIQHDTSKNQIKPALPHSSDQIKLSLFVATYCRTYLFFNGQRSPDKTDWLCALIKSFSAPVCHKEHFPLQKHAYSNILKISQPKIESFQLKNLIIFIFLLKTDCGLIEAILMSTHNLCFEQEWMWKISEFFYLKIFLFRFKIINIFE